MHATDPNGLVVITQLEPIAVVFTIPEGQPARRAEADAPGQPLAVDAYDRDLKNKLATGTLLAIDNQIDPTTGTVKLKAIFPQPDNALFPNQFVNARLLVDTLQGAVIIPAAALQRSPQSTFVYVVKPDQTVEMRTVDVQLTEGDDGRDRKGVAAGEVGRDRRRRQAAAGDEGGARARRRRTAVRRRRTGANEPVPAVHPPADRDLAADGRPAARRRGRLPAAARLRAAAGGLSDDPGRDVLSGRQPRRDGVGRSPRRSSASSARCRG